MDPLLIVSPHLDDAVLSVGQVMAGRPEAIVATVFAGTPRRPRQLTTFDQGCGYSSAGQAMRERRQDDTRALAVLAARPVHFGFSDHQYGPREGTGVELAQHIAHRLLGLVDELAPALHVAVGPLGLAHPDHLATADGFRLALESRPDLEGWLYEDLPSRVLWPEQVQPRLDRWADAGWATELDFLGTGPLEAKEAALDHYRSQHGALRAACGGTLYPALVPERLHRLRRTS